MAFTRFTKNVLNVSALPDRVQNQAQTLKATFDQAGVDIKVALNALIVELEASTSADSIGADVQSVATKTVQAILTAFEEAIADRYTKTEADALIATGTNDLVADIDVNLTTGVITVTKKDGTVETFDTAIEKVPAKFEIVENGDTFALKITNVDGTSTQTDITNFMNIYNFNNSDNITFAVTGEGTEKTVTANIKANSIGLDKLSLSVVSTLEGYMTSARDSATAAKTSETNARASELTATASASAAKTSENNAKYWAEQAQTGGGGITEIPIATADTLGGIKVGEGLEITEEGVLSALGGGSGTKDGNSYIETDLISEVVKYEQGGSSGKSIGVDLSLAEDISEYDEITFLCASDAGSGNIMHPCELRYLTSNIIYNDTDTQILNGSRLNLYSMSTDTRFLSGWFKNGNTFRVNNTFSNSGTGYFVILSIKAIKYCQTIVLDGAVDVDTTPTDGSTNVVTSGGVKEYVDNKITYGTEDLVVGTSELATGTVYFCYE